MRNKHDFYQVINVQCPFEDCGKTFTKTIHVFYVTNQRGDVIEHQIL